MPLDDKDCVLFKTKPIFIQTLSKASTPKEKTEISRPMITKKPMKLTENEEFFENFKVITEYSNEQKEYLHRPHEILISPTITEQNLKEARAGMFQQTFIDYLKTIPKDKIKAFLKKPNYPNDFINDLFIVEISESFEKKQYDHIFQITNEMDFLTKSYRKNMRSCIEAVKILNNFDQNIDKQDITRLLGREIS
jgi:flagellar motor switch protein FliG